MKMPCKKTTIKCWVCGEEHTTVHNAKTCSRRCQAIMIQAMGKCGLPEKLTEEQLEQSISKREKHPATGPFKTHHRAKYWSIVNSVGHHYVFTNIHLFVRSHPDLFDAEDSRMGYLGQKYSTRAACQLSRLRPSRSCMIESWKGWKWHYVSQRKTTQNKFSKETPCER